MYFRFASALVLLVLMSVAGIAIEKQSLALKRAVIRQQYRRDELGDEYARLRLQSQQLGAPVRLFEAREYGRFRGAAPTGSDEADAPRVPMMASRSTACPDP